MAPSYGHSKFTHPRSALFIISPRRLYAWSLLTLLLCRALTSVTPRTLRHLLPLEIFDCGPPRAVFVTRNLPLWLRNMLHLDAVSAQLSSEVESQTASWREKNENLSATIASLRVQVESLEAREFELRSALSESDREARSLRVELRRAQGGTPLVTDVVVPNPIEKTIYGLERKVDRLKGNVISQTEELTKTSGDKSDLKTRVRELALELEEAQKAKTKADLDKVDAERRLGRKIEDLEAKLATKAKEAKDRDLAVQKASRAKSHLEDKDVEVASLKEQVEALKSELTHSRSKFDSVTDKQRSELSEERAKVEKLELKIHILQTELDAEKRKVTTSKTSQKTAEESVRKLKLAQEESNKDSDKLAARVARLEKNLRDMERATLKA